ncbi:replication factor C subunit 5-like protein [Leptotrombidium deliense]|uniref:Activator 1 subunit 5 n=1 Tax=Leptotrombidium deliense TaxID=299467 RepID=A0A443SG47_9ACAR|nr:replication factor C subunit 5-like protein [Leptotrombidium deliense]
MVSEIESNIPWVEKYRPNNFSDIIAHEDIVATIKTFISENRIPHLLFYGPPGTGKTSTILTIAKQLYSPSEFPSMVLEVNTLILDIICKVGLYYHYLGLYRKCYTVIQFDNVFIFIQCMLRMHISKIVYVGFNLFEQLNASDDRGIDIVRGPIMSFASTKTIFKSGFKLVILDEADAMTQDAQNALRRIMEKYTEFTRFCLICNYLSKIIPAIQSRCTRFRFGPLNSQQITPRLDFIINKEALRVDRNGKKALIELAGGDMRKVINVLQSTSMAFDVVNEKNVYLCCGQPQKSDITFILESLLNESFSDIYKKIRDLQQSRGIALIDIITQIHTFIHKNAIKIELFDKLSAIEFHLSSGGSEKLNLSALISAFQTARDVNKDSEMSE